MARFCPEKNVNFFFFVGVQEGKLYQLMILFNILAYHKFQNAVVVHNLKLRPCIVFYMREMELKSMEFCLQMHVTLGSLQFIVGKV